jgi:hypothetical protein
MRRRFVHWAVLGILLICQFTVCFGTETADPNQSSKYLDTVRQFADNVLEYGRDTYGPKHTPLFVDGLNAHTHEPVEWIAPNSDRWFLSNSASQQNLIRTLDGLTRIDGDPKYKQPAMDAIKYHPEPCRGVWPRAGAPIIRRQIPRLRSEQACAVRMGFCIGVDTPPTASTLSRGLMVSLQPMGGSTYRPLAGRCSA